MKFVDDRNLIVIAGGFALGVEQTSPVAGLESLFKVPVNKHFNILTLCSDRECGNSFWGGKVSKN
jgi:hypothetical protein